MPFCKAIPCITKLCLNYAADDIRYSGMCPACYQADCEAGQEQALVMRDNMNKYGTIDKPHTDHYCLKHQITTGEGDICWKCEEEFDAARMLMNLEMSKHQYSLWFVCSKQVLFKCPVNSFDEAKLLYHSLNIGTVAGVRIARYDETEGCESVLHKFC